MSDDSVQVIRADVATEIVRVEELRAEVAPIVSIAGALVVSTPDEYRVAGEAAISLQAAEKRIVAFFKPRKAASRAVWQRDCDDESQLLDPVKQARDIIQNKQTTYRAEQERIRAAEQARLQAEADEAARRERERLEKEAAKLKTPEKREERLAAAAAIVAPVVNVASTTPDIKGQGLRKTWKARVVDRKAAATAMLAWPDWTAYLTINEAELNRFAARTKGAVQVAGVEMYDETTLASASK
jgi:hypothetical protein